MARALAVRVAAAAALAAALVWVAPVTAVAAGAAGATPAAPSQGDGPATWGIGPASSTGPGTRPAFVYDLAPGDAITDAVRVSNHSDGELTLDVYPADAFNTSSGAFDVLAAGETPVDVGAWTALAERVVTIPAGEHVDIPFTLTVPADAEPGDHAGGIVAGRSSGAVDADGDPIRVDHRVGARIYARVDGPLRPALVVDSMRTSFDGTANPVGRGEVTVDYVVTNTGNVRLTAEQAVTVDGPFGLGGTRVVLDDLPELLPGGRYEGRVVVDGVWPAVRLGATLTLRPVAVTGVEEEIVRAGADSWAVPWPALLVVVVAFGATAVLRRRSGEAGHPGEPMTVEGAAS